MKKTTILKEGKLKTIKPSGKADQNFFEQVYDLVRQIPRGSVTSYGAIAKCLGSGKSARMVGWALNGCSAMVPMVPAHRVVNRNGMLSGKAAFNPPELMEELLAREGVMVKENKVVDFKMKFWNPVEDL